MNNQRSGRARRPLKHFTIVSILATAAVLLPAAPAMASWSASTSGTAVTLSGNSADDSVTIKVDEDDWLHHGISTAPFASTRDWDSVNLGEQLISANAAYDLTVNGGGGNDLIVLTGASGLDSVVVNGGPGNDFIFGSALADDLNGGNGNDRIEGQQGPDDVAGGDGSDEVIVNNGDGNDDVAGGDGFDRLEIYGRPTRSDDWLIDTVSGDLRIAGPLTIRTRATEEVYINPLGGRDVVTFQGGVARKASFTVDGHFDNDRLKGGSEPETLDGGENNDQVLGGGGGDNLTGGRGKDQLEGGAGPDVIDSRDGVEETVKCGKGRDRVRADKADTLRGCEQVHRS